MRGVVLRSFGSNWDGDPPVDTGNNLITMGPSEAMFWYWRVNELQVTWSFTDGADVNSGGFTIPKTLVLPGDPPSFLQYEYELVRDFPDGVNQTPQWNSQSAGESNTFIFFSAFCTVGTSINEWTTDFAVSLASLNPVITNNVTAFPAGTLSFLALDPVLGYAYSHDFALYSNVPGVSGSMSVIPASYYPWRNADGVAKYSTATGALL